MQFNGAVDFSCFRPKIPFLGKFGPKNQNFQFKLKFGTETNAGMQNSMVVLNSLVFGRKYLFWINLVQKIEIATLSCYWYLD